jgi:hypothetical protein
MLRRHQKLARLHQELDTIELFDRIHDNTLDPSPVDNRAYVLRQIRRSEVTAEINRLRASKPEFRNRAWKDGAVLLLCAVGYATLHYLFR